MRMHVLQAPPTGADPATCLMANSPILSECFLMLSRKSFRSDMEISLMSSRNLGRFSAMIWQKRYWLTLQQRHSRRTAVNSVPTADTHSDRSTTETGAASVYCPQLALESQSQLLLAVLGCEDDIEIIFIIYKYYIKYIIYYNTYYVIIKFV